MATLHDVLHRLADRITYPSQAHQEAAHAEIDTIPAYVEQLDDEQLDDELGEQLAGDTPKEHPTT